jgi:2-polyprenyl-3-methyl-5-hydroxy-6-metoxy-1,4-benzoquinol methylase
MTIEELKCEVAKYKWYHYIDLGDGVVTPGIAQHRKICEWIGYIVNETGVDYSGKKVLDIGTRDCLHALRAEAKGASAVVAIDNDLSAAARDLVLPHLKSKIELRHQNLYDMAEKDEFDIVQFFGVLYHLRYPFIGLRKAAQVTKTGGIIMIEGGMVTKPALENLELLWCPSPEKNLYDPSSVSFFNFAGLAATMKSFGCELVGRAKFLKRIDTDVDRGFVAFKKTSNVGYEYWEGLHTLRTRDAHDKSDGKPDSQYKGSFQAALGAGNDGGNTCRPDGMHLMSKAPMTTNELQAEVAKYKWYHTIDLGDGVVTPGTSEAKWICEWIEQTVNENGVDYTGKKVLDIGTRDGLHALRAEAKGASAVVAIDNDLSAGARDLVLPHLKSRIELRHQNLYDLTETEEFDIVQFFGVLYYLRYPFIGLRKSVQVTKTGGLIMIESATLAKPVLETLEILWCPSPENNLYDPLSVTFFNVPGLLATMKSFGCEMVGSGKLLMLPGCDINRGFTVFKKTSNVVYEYWEGLHTLHSRFAHDRSDWKPDTQ